MPETAANARFYEWIYYWKYEYTARYLQKPNCHVTASQSGLNYPVCIKTLGVQRVINAESASRCCTMVALIWLDIYYGLHYKFFTAFSYCFFFRPKYCLTIRDLWENPFQIRRRAISFSTSRLVFKIRVMVPTHYRHAVWAYVPTRCSCHGGKQEVYLQHYVTSLKRVNTRFLFAKSFYVIDSRNRISKLVYVIYPVFSFFLNNYFVCSCRLVIFFGEIYSGYNRL